MNKERRKEAKRAEKKAVKRAARKAEKKVVRKEARKETKKARKKRNRSPIRRNLTQRKQPQHQDLVRRPLARSQRKPKGTRATRVVRIAGAT